VANRTRGGALELLLLGPIAAKRDGHEIAIAGARQRALLAVLAASAGEVVASDRLIDELWGDEPPDTASTALHGLVSQLRKTLEPDRSPGAGPTVILTRAPGYVLNAEPDMLDVERFERLAAEGRSLLERGDCGAASDRLRQALELWRGAALAGAHETPSTRAETLRLEELKLEAIEDRVDADVALGRHADLVPELEALVRREPFRERLSGQLMLALYRSGRQAEALELYQRTRARFVDELGIEPTPRLRELEQAILRQDPELDAGLPRLRARARLRRNRRRVSVTFAAVALAAVTGIAILLALRGNGSPSPGVGPNMLAVVDLATRRIEASVRVGTSPNAIAYGHGSLWVANTDDETLSRIDPRTREVVATIGVGPAVDLAIGPDAVWTANGIDGTVGRVDPVSGVRIATIDLRGDDPVVPNTVNAVAVGGGAVWAAVARSVVRIDPATNRVARVVKLVATPFFVRYGHGSVWAATSAERLLRIEPRTGDITGATRTGFPEGLEVLDEGVAVLADDAWVVDPTSGRLLVTVNIPGYASAIADLPGPRFWAGTWEGSVALLDSAVRNPPEPIELNGEIQSMVVADGRLWVAVRESSPSP
jgi:YVTN family beta-propeller protein